MAQLGAVILTRDDGFRASVIRTLHSGRVPVGILTQDPDQHPREPDFAVVDVRGDAAAALTDLEVLRARHVSTAIFAVAESTDPDVILRAMRAGANEFLVWSVSDTAAPDATSTDEALHEAIARWQARREALLSAARQPGAVLLFLGAKGGAGTTTVSVNCAVELARLTERNTVIVDLKACLGRSRCSSACDRVSRSST